MHCFGCRVLEVVDNSLEPNGTVPEIGTVVSVDIRGDQIIDAILLVLGAVSAVVEKSNGIVARASQLLGVAVDCALQFSKSRVLHDPHFEANLAEGGADGLDVVVRVGEIEPVELIVLVANQQRDALGGLGIPGNQEHEQRG